MNSLSLSRRRFLSSAALLGGAALGGTIGPALTGSAWAAAHGFDSLSIDSRVIEVKGKAAKVFGILRPDGGHGLVVK